MVPFTQPVGIISHQPSGIAYHRLELVGRLDAGRFTISELDPSFVNHEVPMTKSDHALIYHYRQCNHLRAALRAHDQIDSGNVRDGYLIYHPDWELAFAYAFEMRRQALVSLPSRASIVEMQADLIKSTLPFPDGRRVDTMLRSQLLGSEFFANREHIVVLEHDSPATGALHLPSPAQAVPLSYSLAN